MSTTVHVLRAKLHRATVTDANIDYEGSISIAADLMEAVGMFPYEQIHVWNLTRGTRLYTYAIEGQAQSGVICINGAAAHLTQPGDQVILATFAQIDIEQAKTWTPIVAVLDDKNQIKQPS